MTRPKHFSRSIRIDVNDSILKFVDHAAGVVGLSRAEFIRTAAIEKSLAIHRTFLDAELAKRDV